MKVTYIGNFSEPYCTEVHIAKTLEELGCEVVKMQENQMQIPNLISNGLTSDLVLFTRTWINAQHKHAQALIQAFRQLEAEGVKTASYHLDLYLGISREDSLDGDPFWDTQYVFTPDGDIKSQAKFENLNINHIYIKPGVYKGECYAGEYTESLSSDVTFVGSVQGYHKEWPYRQMLHNWLQDTFGPRYRKWGHPERIVRNDDLNKLYASVKAVVGDTLCPGFSKPYYWSDRAYETIGRGGPLIHPMIEGMDEEFENRTHILYYEYGDFNTLNSLIEELVEDQNLRYRLRAKGIEKVSRDCTYHNRLRQAFKAMKLELPNG